MRTILRHASRLLNRFAADRSGNVAIVFGASLIPVVGLAGAAIDFSAAYNIRHHLQSAADTAALAATRNYGKSWSQRQQIANDAFYANLADIGEGFSVSFNIEDHGQRHYVTASTTVQTKFMGLMGVEEIVTAVEAEAVTPDAKVEVVLVLDNTGSMWSQDKIGILKESAHNFLDMMETASQIPGKELKIGLVPFTTNIRVDADTYEDAEWIHMPSWADPDDWRGCIYDRHQPYDTDDTIPDIDDEDTLFDPDPNRGFSYWRCRMAKVHELSNDFTSLNNRVDDMRASGNTNITLGVTWGLHLLSSTTPFGQGATWSDVETTKILIVLTDGQNTQSRWSYSTSSIDSRTQMACNEVKSKNVLVYTVRVVNGNETLLKNCATDDWMYTDIQNASDLDATFQQLAADIINRHLRLTM